MPSQSSDDVAIALRNSVKLGLSLVATWGVALFVRFYLPRYLGPERFGLFSFAETFAATYFILLNLGVETLLQKEVPVHPEYTNRIAGAVYTIRIGMGLVLLAALSMTLRVSGRDDEAQWLVAAFGVGQIAYHYGQMVGTALQSNAKVGGLAAINVISKVCWGLWIVSCIVLKAPLVFLASAFAVSETVRALVLHQIAKRQIGYVFKVDMPAALAALKMSVPFYVNSVVITLCSKLDVTLLAFQTDDDRMVGWYSAASNLAGLALLLTPIVQSVLMPLMNRAIARSHEEFWSIIRRSIEAILAVTVPITLFIALGADLWVRIAFGEAYAPSAMSLRMLAPLFVFTYTAILLSMSLISLNRGWLLTTISIIGLCVNPLLALTLTPLCARWFGEGGAGIGAASGVVGMELTVTTILLVKLGSNAFDQHSMRFVAKQLLAVVLTVAIHLVLSSIGALRLFVDAVVYVGMVFALGAVKVSDVEQVVRLILNRKKPVVG
jgi:O-antigen/teichoic acid export membrane protein